VDSACRAIFAGLHLLVYRTLRLRTPGYVACTRAPITEYSVLYPLADLILRESIHDDESAQVVMRVGNSWLPRRAACQTVRGCGTEADDILFSLRRGCSNVQLETYDELHSLLLIPHLRTVRY
jgi:hypothetical protein